jgi:hypothetical protein
MKAQFKYKIITPDEDYRKAVVEKSGMSTAEFTIEQVEAKQKVWTDEKRQFEGQIIIEQAKVDNIAHHNPFVLDMTEKDQYAVWMYYEARRTVTELQKQVDMRITALDEYQTEKEEILNLLGLQKTSV